MKPHAISISRSITKDKRLTAVFSLALFDSTPSWHLTMSESKANNNNNHHNNRNQQTKIIFIDCSAHTLHRIHIDVRDSFSAFLSLSLSMFCVFHLLCRSPYTRKLKEEEEEKKNETR